MASPDFVRACRSCGEMIVVTDDTTECAYCGVPILRCSWCGQIPDDPEQQRCAACTSWLQKPTSSGGGVPEKSQSFSLKAKVTVGIIVVIVLGALAALGDFTPTPEPSIDVYPRPTFYGGEPMSDELIQKGEICNERYPHDEDAFLGCMLGLP